MPRGLRGGHTVEGTRRPRLAGRASSRDGLSSASLAALSSRAPVGGGGGDDVTEGDVEGQRFVGSADGVDGLWNDDRRRSRYVRELLRAPAEVASDASAPSRIPKVVVQYWHDAADIPPDVEACMSSWDVLQLGGVSRRVFEDRTARAFIADELTEDHVLAFERCHHPAMRCDYFRLCYIHRLGGLYVDADDVMLGDVSWVFDGACLKVRPLCYDLSSQTMANLEDALGEGGRLDERIFYFNNNPLAAPAGHPIVGDALQRATEMLLRGGRAIADIQSTTGPGNLTACLVSHDINRRAGGCGRDFEILMGWDDVAVSVWPLSYRDDYRNWRRWQPGDDDLAGGRRSDGSRGPMA